MTIYMDGMSWQETEAKVGDKMILVEKKDILKEIKWYDLRHDNGKGVAGNADPTHRRYHGWRGTTNDLSVEALGLHEITKVQKFKNGNVRIWLGEDLKSEEE